MGIYEKAMLRQLLRNRQRSPMTREVLKAEHRAATEKMAEVLEFRHRRSEELIRFALEVAGQQPQMATTALERAMDYLTVLRTDRARVLNAKAARIHSKLGQFMTSGLQESGMFDTLLADHTEPRLVADVEVVQQNISCNPFS